MMNKKIQKTKRRVIWFGICEWKNEDLQILFSLHWDSRIIEKKKKEKKKKEKKKKEKKKKEKKEITTPGVPRLSPTLVLTRPEEA